MLDAPHRLSATATRTEPIHVRDKQNAVAVYSYGFGWWTAACSCGWQGRRRYLKATALLDAWTHFTNQNCDLSDPLVIGA
jgi:hypothetical protein